MTQWARHWVGCFSSSVCWWWKCFTANWLITHTTLKNMQTKCCLLRYAMALALLVRRLSRWAWIRPWAIWSNYGCPCSMQGIWTRRPLTVPSSYKDSMIPWYRSPDKVFLILCLSPFSLWPDFGIFCTVLPHQKACSSCFPSSSSGFRDKECIGSFSTISWFH